MKKRTLCLWTVLTILTLVEIFRAVTEYAYYGRGLGFGLTVVIPLLVLLPLMIGYQITQITFLRRCQRKKTKIFCIHIILLSIFSGSLAALLFIIISR